VAKFEEWHQALAEVVAEGNGVVTVRLIDIRETPHLLRMARDLGAGNLELRILSAIGELLEAVRIGPRHRAPRCLLCTKPLHGRRLAVTAMVLRAARDDPKALFVIGLCLNCVRSVGGHSQLWPVIMPVLREASPDLQDISPRLADEMGHA
jgi:hypothetical protein